MSEDTSIPQEPVPVTQVADTPKEEVSQEAVVDKVLQESKEIIEKELAKDRPNDGNGNAVVTDYTLKDSPKQEYPSHSLPASDLLTYLKVLRELSKMNIDESELDWLKLKDVLKESGDFRTPGNLYQDRFEDPDSEFRQGVLKRDGKILSPRTLKFKDSEGELKGDLAILKLNKVLGIGDTVTIFLPHTGMWVNIKPPLESDIIQFYYACIREQIVFGRATFGLTLSGFSGHIQSQLFSFILKHIHSTNYKDIAIENLKNYILIHDIPFLILGLACASYPNGYQFERVCTSDVNTCKHVAKETINLIKLFFIDVKAFTEAQKAIYEEDRVNKLTIEHYNKYQTEHTKTTAALVDINDSISLRLKIPTAEEFFHDGLQWVRDVTDAVDNIVNLSSREEDRTEEEKREILTNEIRTTSLRQYDHFVEQIIVDNATITDRETISKSLAALTGDDTIRINILEKILKFKVATTIGIVGIPEYKCPACGQLQNTKPLKEGFSRVIPLDVLNLFFSLLITRVTKIQRRNPEGT